LVFVGGYGVYSFPRARDVGYLPSSDEYIAYIIWVYECYAISAEGIVAVVVGAREGRERREGGE
jgi:hypothetical protein